MDYKEAQKAKQDKVARKLFREIIMARELRAKEFGEIKWVVPGLLSDGVTILAANPKAGKSWMALDMAIAVSQGEEFLGELPTVKGPVLYLALEDGERRVKSRLDTLDEENRALEGLDFQFEWAPIREGGLEALEMWLAKNPGAKLIIIDTLRKVRSERRITQGVYEHDYDAVDPLNILGHKHGIAVVVVHHTSKGKQEDPFMKVSGTLGLLGASDAVLVLDVNPETGLASLHIQGRDVESKTIEISFNPVERRWMIMQALEPTGVKKSILELLESNEGGLGPKEISDAVEVSTKTVRRKLIELESDGLVEGEGFTTKRVYRIRNKIRE